MVLSSNVSLSMYQSTRVSQKSSNILVIWDNSGALGTFVEIVMVMNYTGLWDTKFAWYSLFGTHRIYFYCLGSSFILIWPCPIVEVLASWAKFLEASGYCTEINSTVAFRETKVFVCFSGGMAQLELVKHKFQN